MTQKPKILIIIPAYNEERVIARLIREIKKQHPQYASVVINDGSSDRTREEAENAGARVAELPYNLGIGGAMQCGFRLAAQENFDIAAQIDGDGQHDPKYLDTIIRPVLEGRMDLCIGSRFLEDRSGFQSTFTRRIGIVFFSHLLKLLTGVSISDPTSGFRAYGRKAIELFNEDYPVDFPEPEAVIMCKRRRLKVGEVPVKMRKRLGGISSIRYLKTVYYMIKVTLAILIATIRKAK